MLKKKRIKILDAKRQKHLKFFDGMEINSIKKEKKEQNRKH
jgi:hypothetical protein